MRYRRYPFPRRLGEILCFFSISVLLPSVFIYGIIAQLPVIHEPGSFLYIFTILLATFIVANIEGNLMACMIIDTSVDQDRVAAASYGVRDYEGWRHCLQCDQWAPPRSWHCKFCGVCILRRDHHCMFSGYCIGHENHRYFMCFLFYLMVGSVYYLVYCLIYIWINGTQVLNLLKNSVDSLFMMFCILNIILLVVTLVALKYYMPLLLKGQVYVEGKKNILDYDNGVINNLKTVFGQRMKLAWIFPSIESRLPEDGYAWEKQLLTEIKLNN